MPRFLVAWLDLVLRVIKPCHKVWLKGLKRLNDNPLTLNSPGVILCLNVHIVPQNMAKYDVRDQFRKFRHFDWCLVSSGYSALEPHTKSQVYNGPAFVLFSLSDLLCSAIPTCSIHPLRTGHFLYMLLSPSFYNAQCSCSLHCDYHPWK